MHIRKFDSMLVARRRLLLFSVLVGTLLAMSGIASAHVWTIGWKSIGGGLTFYGLSYHDNLDSSYDDFATNPAGFVINGTNVTFDLGSVVDLNNCYGPGGLTTGTCSPIWNGLGLDGAIETSEYSTGTSDTYGKYAIASLSDSELAALSIGTGSNSVLLSTFANNVHWAGMDYASATVPIDIVVTPPSTSVPGPSGLGLMGLGLLLLAGVSMRLRRRPAQDEELAGA